MSIVQNVNYYLFTPLPVIFSLYLIGWKYKHYMLMSVQ